MVTYPAKINRYSIHTSTSKTAIRLYGSEKPNKDGKENLDQSIIGDLQFSSESTEIQNQPFINRGGFIDASYPLSLLPSVLILLHHSDVLFINENGHFTNHNN